MLRTTGNLILIFLTTKLKKKKDHQHQRYEEKCEKYKNSQKPAKRQSDRH